MGAAEIAQALGGRRCGGQWVVRCVVHEDRNPSLALADGDDDRLLVHCHAGCDGRDVLAELRQRGLLEGASRRREVLPAARRERPTPLPPIDRIRAILTRSTALKGTLAEKYLRNRGLDPGLANREALRFLPPMGDYPASMVAIVTDVRDASRVMSLQFTELKPDGTRGDRKFLRGALAGGGVVRLVEDAEVTCDLGIAEGTESALAVMTAMKHEGRTILPAWSALNAGNMAKLPVLSGIERMYIFADNDPNGPGPAKAETLAQRWADAGREVRIALPPAGDWNTAP